jgi:hypothetical protein
MRSHDAAAALVMKDGSLNCDEVQGVITQKDILDTLVRDTELY